jgi:all-trans-retinol dehydrogenase (NAD+)
MFAQKNRNTRIVILDKVAPAYSMPSPYIHYVPVDLSIPEEIKDACERVKKEYGDPTVVFLNAGIAIPYTISNIPDKTLDKVFAVNTLSHYRVVREFLPSICARNHGMIITTASLAGYVVPPGMVDYCASKSAAIAFHEGLTAELKHRYNAPKVRTICVCPNFARTKLADGFVNKSNFLSPTLYPETVAEAIFAQVLSGNSGFVTIPKTHSWFAQTVRAWPWWMQKGVSDGLKEVMRTVEGTRKDA